MRYCDENHSSFANNPATRFRPTDDKKNVTSSPTAIRHRYFPQPSAPPSRHHLHSEEITMADISSTISNEQKKKEKKNGLRRFFFPTTRRPCTISTRRRREEERGQTTLTQSIPTKSASTIWRLLVEGTGDQYNDPYRSTTASAHFKDVRKTRAKQIWRGKGGWGVVEKSEGLLAGVLQ